VDPMKIIQLIQQQPQRYKLDGQDKLRITQNLPDREQRFRAVQKLLDMLRG